MKYCKKILAFVAGGLITASSVAQEKASITVRKVDDAPVISKHIYGHFAEHLGRCIYGGFYVGETSNVPNTDGVRDDIIKALKELKVPNLRWPGGCFADTYHWKDGIGPKEDRPTIVNTWWGGVTEDNSFGTHDFLNLCEVLDAEPYLAANVGSGTVREFADWLQYVNHVGPSPMADLRKKYGRETPWGVKYWGVGNEAWGCGGNMTAEYYANLYRKYATFMTSWGERHLFRIASGANVDNYHWTEVMMKNIPQNLIEGVALHSYSFVEWDEKGSSVDFNKAQYFSTMQSALRMEELVTKHSVIMDKYDPEGKIALVVDEWGGWYDTMDDGMNSALYQQNTMRDAMIAGTTLNTFNNHSSRVRIANLAQTVNVLQAVILTKEEKMILTPTYYVMKMYNVHQDAKLLPIQLISPDYDFNGESLPAVSVSASEKDEVTHISLVNIDASKKVEVTLNLDDLNVKGFTAEVLTSSKLQDCNSFENPEKVAPKEFKDFKLKKGSLTVTLPPFSVVVLEGK
ncbi:alpha-N-arabinofuranosidase [Neptunitalea chrysea]|uniref:non-reducing end alpha-L-arabinofuranosidase n=1 Tax=Neptunitalea chrysea TaxID=1647581 RepID=A0A9W6ETX9_9FLAO|nr:alpha-L-arabinofuranosidase C-terminal domain-containing protein [Neptunitalea chrysea]GLB52745.1 alpha-N-arabinofuranosidase [Neptunitalea chrysea]